SGCEPSLFGSRYDGLVVRTTGVASGVVAFVAVAVSIVVLKPLSFARLNTLTPSAIASSVTREIWKWRETRRSSRESQAPATLWRGTVGRKLAPPWPYRPP